MEAVADRVLGDLGLAEHQALLVAHQDRAHPHVHIMVNRVHPETGMAWERWQDRPQIERSLRELERTLGLREVAGRLYQLEGQEPPEPRLLTSGERRQAERTGEPAFPDRVRAHLPDLRAARSWAELDETLAAHGLRLERKGQGLVITDGERQVKASRVARDLSLHRLEERFRAPYSGREQEQATREPLSPAVQQVASAVGERERVAALRTERSRAEQDLATARDRLQRFEAAMEHVQYASQQFDAALARVYWEPGAARARLMRLSAELGAEQAAARLQTAPERVGVLKTIERPRALGLVRTQDDGPARSAAPSAAFRSRELAEAERALGAVVREQGHRTGPQLDLPGTTTGPSAEVARADAADVVTRAAERVRRLQQETQHAPSLGLLERSIGRVVDRLLPHEIAQLRRVLSAPQAAIAFKAREAVKDIVLGREEQER
jgi:hypothetical protein